MRRSLVVASAIVLFALISGAVYIFTGSGTNLENLENLKFRLGTNLILAQNKLKEQKDELLGINATLRQSFPAAAAAGDNMRDIMNAVKKTDSLFIDPYGANPTLISGGSLASQSISTQRSKINKIIASWQKKTDIFYIQNMSSEETQNIKDDAEKIVAYIQSIFSIVNNLTTENSGLSSFVIETQVSQVASPSVVENLVVSMNNNISESQTAGSSATTNGNTEDNSGPIAGSTPSASNNSSITADDVAELENQIAETENEIIEIQAQIAAVEQQIAEINVVPIEPVVDVAPPTDPNTDTGPNPGSVTDFVPRKINTKQPVIVQPGPAVLVPGTDPY